MEAEPFGAQKAAVSNENALVHNSQRLAFLKGCGGFGGVADLGVIVRQGDEHGWIAGVNFGPMFQQTEPF